MERNLAVYGLAIKCHATSCQPHNVGMGTESDTALALAQNLQKLMDRGGLSQAELARRSGVGQRTLSTLLNLSDPRSINPRTRTLSRLAAYFKIPPWILMVPNLPTDMLESPRFATMIENYLDAPEGGRAQIERIAESEVRYAIAEGKVTRTAKTGT